MSILDPVFLHNYIKNLFEIKEPEIILYLILTSFFIGIIFLTYHFVIKEYSKEWVNLKILSKIVVSFIFGFFCMIHAILFMSIPLGLTGGFHRIRGPIAAILLITLSLLPPYLIMKYAKKSKKPLKDIKKTIKLLLSLSLFWFLIVFFIVSVLEIEVFFISAILFIILILPYWYLNKVCYKEFNWKLPFYKTLNRVKK